jgi:uncharacterized protein YnzC (UPF0291/DUF896 family)
VQATYRLQADELNIDFVEAIKQMFKQKTVEISIVDEQEEDLAFGKAIEYGLQSETVSKDELYKALRAN